MQRVEVHNSRITHDILPRTGDSAYVFDSIWTAALALNKTKSRLEKHNLTFANFSYENENGHTISKIIYEEALKVKFFGLTVSIYIATYVCITLI